MGWKDEYGQHLIHLIVTHFVNLNRHLNEVFLFQVNKDGSPANTNTNKRGSIPTNQFDITLDGELRHHDTKSLMKSCETLAFLVRDAAHITPHNFESCVHCIRTFVEASINGGRSSLLTVSK